MSVKISPRVPAEVADSLRTLLAAKRDTKVQTMASPEGTTIVRASWAHVTGRATRWLVWYGPVWVGIYDQERAALNATSTGLIQFSVARSTGLRVGVYDGDASGMDTDGGRWQTVCEAHTFICSHGSLTLARDMASCPEDWCEACSAIANGCGCVEEDHTDEHTTRCALYGQTATAFPAGARLAA